MEENQLRFLKPDQMTRIGERCQRAEEMTHTELLYWYRIDVSNLLEEHDRLRRLLTTINFARILKLIGSRI